MRLIELKQSSPERFTLIFDDGRQIKSSLSVVTERFLHAGIELSEEEYTDLCSASALSLCKARSIRIINARPMSVKEMRDRLVEKGESPENAEFCANWLCEMGLINDVSYASSVVRHYAAKGYGVSRVRQELYRHGIDRELWDYALKEMPEQDERIERFIRTRLTDPDDKSQINKISAALIRRGYTWEQIRHALNNLNFDEDYQ